LGSTDPRFLSPQLDTSSHCETTDTGLAHRQGTPVYVPASACTHCAYHAQKNGQAELACVAGCIPRWSPIQAFTRMVTNNVAN